MHLKNFSIINRKGIIRLSPCYDLLDNHRPESAHRGNCTDLERKEENLTRS
ncbi:MAG: hypothetical protein R2751_10220 [Bacteroidales bacterium]